MSVQKLFRQDSSGSFRRFFAWAKTGWVRPWHRAYDTVLFSRGAAFEGTPAVSPRDISNFITHAACHHLRGLSPPRALGRPGFGVTAWFADGRIARKMATRHGNPLEADCFQAVLADIPRPWYTAPRYMAQSGTIHSRGLPDGCDYAVYIAQDHRPDRQGMRCGAVTCLGRVVFLAVFHRRPGTGLYKLSFVGTNPALAIGNGFEERIALRAIHRGLALVGRTPGLCMDFMGTITPEAARLGCSLFRRLRQDEMTRLRALTKNEFAALYRQVATYPYPRFDAVQQVGLPDMVLPLTREIRAAVGAGIKTVVRI